MGAPYYYPGGANRRDLVIAGLVLAVAIGLGVLLT